MSQQQTTPPGLRNQAGVRTAARVVAVVLLVVGPILVVRGFSSFVSGMDDPMDSGSGDLLAFGLGGVCTVLGLLAASIGWMGAQASYVSGETMPVLKDSAAYLSDGQGLGAIGRTGQPGAATTTGPYCRQCGTRNDAEASFCDSCGQSLA
jgi:hypothetical protein